MVALTGQQCGKKFLLREGQDLEADRKAAGGIDGGETAMHANQIAPTRRDAGCCLQILLPSRLKVLPELRAAGAERLSEFRREVITRPSVVRLGELASMRKECRNVRVAVEIFQHAGLGRLRHVHQAIHVGGIELEAQLYP